MVKYVIYGRKMASQGKTDINYNINIVGYESLIVQLVLYQDTTMSIAC